MRFRDDQKGFSLIEMVLVIAIVSILASLSLTMFGRIRYANTEKMVNYVYDALKKLQIRAMSKAEPSYLHIYKDGNDYYFITSSSPDYEAKDMGKKGTSLGGSIIISKVVGTDSPKEITGTSDHIVVSFKKDGSVREQDSDGHPLEDIQKIIIKAKKGSTEVEIKINHKTGKCIAEKK